MSSNAKKRAREARRASAAKNGMALIGRNEPCPCGSGKKIKKCCLRKINALAALPPALRETILVNRILNGGHRPEAVPPAVAERFAAVQAAQAEAQSDNPDDMAAQVVAGTAVAYAEGEPVTQLEGGYVEIDGERIPLKCGTIAIDEGEGTP